MASPGDPLQAPGIFVVPACVLIVDDNNDRIHRIVSSIANPGDDPGSREPKGKQKRALDEADGVVARAAELLRLRRTTLVEKMRKYELRAVEPEDGTRRSPGRHLPHFAYNSWCRTIGGGSDVRLMHRIVTERHFFAGFLTLRPLPPA